MRNPPRSALPHALAAVLCVTTAVGACASSAPGRRFVIAANDEKVHWDDTGKMVLGAPGKDTVSILDVTNREAPRIVANLALDNTVIGPPTNVAIAPDDSIALVANSMAWTQDADGVWKNAPDTRIHIIDLRASPPRAVGTVDAGKQPSGIDISPKGDLAIVANRAEKSVTVLTIAGTSLKAIETIAMNDEVATVAFTPDGKRALVVKQPAHKLAVLDVNGTKVTYGGVDIEVGQWPYNVVVTPDGKLALTADLGAKGGSDGKPDTVSVVDLEQNPPRVIDRVEVGDGPEGLAISPTGKTAVVMILRGSNGDRSAPFFHRNGSVVALKIDGKKVTRQNEIEVRALPEGAAFSSDGSHVYVGNFLDSDLSILRVTSDGLIDTGKRIALPGHPAALR